MLITNLILADNLTRPEGRQSAPPPPPRTAVYTTSTYPPSESAPPQIPHNPLLSHYPSSRTSHPHTPSPRFSYTTAYLQSAASRPNSITFAEAFPAPTSAPVTDPTVALGNLRLDYSTGGCYHQDEDGEDGEQLLTLPRQQRDAARDGMKRSNRRERKGKDRDAVRYFNHNHGNGEVGKGKGKEKDTEPETETGMEMEAERRRSDKGKGKETDFGPFQHQHQSHSQFQFQHPSGYRPVTVEDALEDEEAGYDYRGEDEMEEEW
ncbi:hypothetical protein C8A03DRAFT_33085 [Achaetomium macrosporum]|uniref:Uncharacterized protein n=1 Tax=Achaetomium macrosporum TaxID=79813 RepID=A0AAN7CBA1_9PEZI|nr:hypothetical protein C8A03DRAFT_33085 [Achaetomium macrosporum]